MDTSTMKNVLVTGANRGIGFEIARQLLKKGFHVIISGRNELKLLEALNRLKLESPSVEMILMDVGTFDRVKMAAKNLTERNIKLDVVINNAAILLKEDRSMIGHDEV
jgi:short-subunit dehydrogenase